MSKKREPLWPCDMRIEVLGVTGGYASGKTLFICSIDPANTRLYDFEKSAGTYASGLGIDRVDVPGLLTEKHPKGFSPRAAFEWWYSEIKTIKPGDGPSVIAVDPISDIEDGMVDWVKARHKEWGFKTEESFLSTGGIFWSKVKSEWKRVLADLAARCETFAFTTHLKFVWKAGKPTTQQTPKGKTTLMELASLFLFLDRVSDQKAPSATILKSRLAVTKVVDGELRIMPVLPPRILVATPKSIRDYILNPPDYDALKPWEKEQEKVLSEADKLEMEREISENNRAAAEASVEASKQANKAQSAREIALARLKPALVKAAEEAMPMEGNSEGATEDAPKDVIPDDQAQAESVMAHPPLVEQIIEKGKLIDASRATYAWLRSRGVDVSGFKGPDCLVDFIPYLNEAELLGLKEICGISLD